MSGLVLYLAKYAFWSCFAVFSTFNENFLGIKIFSLLDLEIQWEPPRRLLVSPIQYEDPIWENGWMQLRPQSQEGIMVIKEMRKLPQLASRCFPPCVYKTWRRGVRRRLTTRRHDHSDAQGTHWRKLDDSCQKLVNASSVKNTCKRGLYVVERSGSVWGAPRS